MSSILNSADILNGVDESWEEIGDEFELCPDISNEENKCPLTSLTMDNSFQMQPLHQYSSEIISERNQTTPNSSLEDQNDMNASRNPSFEILSKSSDNFYSEMTNNDTIDKQPVCLSYEKINCNSSNLGGLSKRIRNNIRWVKLYKDVFRRRKSNAYTFNAKLYEEKSFRKNSDPQSPTLLFGIFATNVLCFVVGYSLGWWNRNSLPTYSVYEFHFD